MTFISTLSMQRRRLEAVPAYTHDAPEAVVLDLAIPTITGTYLISNNMPQLVSPAGETMIFATPLKVDGQVLIHLAFGTDNRRIAHTLTVTDFGQLLRSLETVQALALLEQGD